VSDPATPSRIPRVDLIVELEATPRFVVNAESEADREALGRWIRQIHPAIDDLLCQLHEKRRAA
jgi:hypothetical protein